MQFISEYVNSTISNYQIDSTIIQNVQACLNEEWKVSGWISLLLCNRKCIILKFNNGIFVNQGFVVNDKRVLRVIGNHQIGDIVYNGQSIVVEGIVDLEHGARFEGLVLTEIEGKIGIPFGYGEMYDDDGLLLYKGIMINWKRFGYGTSYHDNGLIEYEGYWCDNNRFGSGKVYDRKGDLVNECNWYNGKEGVFYEGDGSEPMNIGMKHLKLIDHCILVDCIVSLFCNLESIEIGNDSFESVKTFIIDGLSRLKTIKIGMNSFTQKKYGHDNNQWKSFHILNCESLESIEIGEYSFSDFGGQFKLSNLPQLQDIQIGAIGCESSNFYYSSFVIGGILNDIEYLNDQIFLLYNP